MANSSQLDLLKGAYDDYVAQLNKNKVSAQNAIASSTEKAKSLLDNRLKSQGINNSGAGLSQYTALANQMNNNIASSNQAYNTDLASATKDYKQNLANYYDTYNNQVKSEAESLLQNMNNEQAQAYLAELGSNDNIYDDTKSYLSQYLNSVNNQKSAQALDTAKNELSQLDSYEAMQNYISNAQANGTLSDEQIATLQNYSDVLSGGWQTSKTNTINTLTELMDTIGANSGNADYGKLLNAYQQLRGANTQEEYNKLFNELNVNELISTAGTSKSVYDEWSDITNMKNGESVSLNTLNTLVEQGTVTKNSKTGMYTCVINGKTYTFNSSGKLTSGGISEESSNETSSTTSNNESSSTSSSNSENTSTSSTTNKEEKLSTTGNPQKDLKNMTNSEYSAYLKSLPTSINNIKSGQTITSAMERELQKYPYEVAEADEESGYDTYYYNVNGKKIVVYNGRVLNVLNN